MLSFAADENFDVNILRGLERRRPTLDVVRVQDTEMYSADDSDMLAWAADAGRIVLTHDKSTVPGHAYDRVRAGEPMCGVFVVLPGTPISKAVDDLLNLAIASDEGEWEGQVVYIPL
jgi:hypothetical protein